MADEKHPGGKSGGFTVPSGGVGGTPEEAAAAQHGPKPKQGLKGILPSHLHGELKKFEPGN